MCMAVTFMLAAAVVEANQCSSGRECPSSNKPQNVVSLLQTKLQMDVPEEGSRLASKSTAHREHQNHQTGGNSLDGLWSSKSSEELIRSYMSALYHEELENKPEWRDKWNETEMVYKKFGHLQGGDFPHSLREEWTQFAAGSRKAFAPEYMTMNLKRRLAPSNTWVEVIRRWSFTGEGTSWAHGSCWFYQFTGSGIFLNVGRTATFDGNNSFAVKEMQKEVPALHKIGNEDEVLTAYAHAKGLDTVQTAYSKNWDGNMPELIYFGGSCRTMSIKTGCIPGLEMRTGLHGNQLCICQEHGLLNCDGSSVAAP